jgi:DNA polymerase alpha-associated DNA helicase A
VDNILERLLELPPNEKGEKLKVTRIGHPARVMAHDGILDSTLDVKAGRTDQVCDSWYSYHILNFSDCL